MLLEKASGGVWSIRRQSVEHTVLRMHNNAKNEDNSIVVHNETTKVLNHKFANVQQCDANATMPAR